MSFVFRSFWSYRWYALMFTVGLLASLPYTPAQIHGALEVVGVLMLVALFASLLVPFAAFSQPESRPKWILQNAPLAAFGAYAMEVLKEPTLVKIVLILAAMGMHLSYWSSGIHSRAYRLEQFKLGLAAELPATTKLIACLNGMGRSELGDALVQSALSQNGIATQLFWDSLPVEVIHLIDQAKSELYESAKIREQIHAMVRIKISPT